MATDRLRVVKGVMFHSDSVVPFSRVQHLDVEQGPLERLFGIARLILHTAGTHNSSVTLPGLQHETATAMREDIRRHVKQESM
jgi:membrane protein YdbS with pleckstrin-like domain